MTPLQRVQEKFSQEIIETHAFRGDETVIIRPGALGAVAKFLKETPELDFNFFAFQFHNKPDDSVHCRMRRPYI